MNILDRIVADKRREVAFRKEQRPVKLLERTPFFDAPCVSMVDHLRRKDTVGVIAEIKRKSPSQGIMHANVDVAKLSVGYMQAGASALSVLTDEAYFGGKIEDLVTARKFNRGPVLRKDFTVDEYQIIEAKSMGADAILLIAAIISPKETAKLATFARSCGLEVLMEVHNRKELESHICADIDLVGVNNRNLKDFNIHTELSEALLEHIPREFVRISESGISDARVMHHLKRLGFDGFLVGGYFMKHERPQDACADLIRQVELLIESGTN